MFLFTKAFYLSLLRQNVRRWRKRGMACYSTSFAKFASTQYVSLSGAAVPSRPFSDMTTLERRTPSSFAPDWRTYDGGLNVEGYCKNSSCRAYQHLVTMPLGYRTYRFSIDNSLCKCPTCGERVKEEITCVFHDALYKYDGRQEVNGDSVEKKIDWKETKADAYYRFKD
ncbi:MAG: hypothetical protein MRERC_2c102 [Mycoplasmataceae bacterium RC_NB112A]|nr:MAG: hypothetical protein MRERC_2c102 [Mycoplasmataceae bacterium RC_NB112A]